MFWKALLFTTLVVGALAEYNYTISEEQRNQFKSMLRNYCEKNGAADKVEEVTTAMETFAECVKSIIDPEVLKKEIDEAKPNGALDEVFKKYCAKSPQLKTCIHSLTTGVAPCLETTLRDKIGFADNATEQLIDFVCYKDGDRIALFIAEEGPQCFTQKSSNIRECYSTVKEGVPANAADVQKLSTEEQCAKYDQFSQCVVTALEECSTPTPGNMAESLFRFVRKSSPCPKKD